MEEIFDINDFYMTEYICSECVAGSVRKMRAWKSQYDWLRISNEGTIINPKLI